MKKIIISVFILVLSTVLLMGTAMMILPGMPAKSPQGVQNDGDIYAMGSGRPIVVMVENSLAARPQSGLHLADVVFEVVAEYGITRFVTVFNTRDASIVGPFRSARPHFAEIARSFDPIYCFFGTYPQCYQYIESLGMHALSAMADNSGLSSIAGGCPYWRDWNRSKVQEHTAFTSTLQIKQRAQEMGYSLDGNGIPFEYKGDAPEGQRGGVSNIYVDFGTEAYSPRGFNVNFKYDMASNSYLRYMGGKAHTDYETGQIISVKNVLVLTTDIQGPVDQWKHMNVRTTGSGQGFYFIDGQAIQGIWERGSAANPFVFKDSNGKTVKLNAGNTWVCMVMPGKVGWE
ncbi:MAG: DUF3048 domain-containing protein [Actinobacteria bacterium]|nr:DUF3048 domain-containing protein [Actinomycetota bacterium]